MGQETSILKLTEDFLGVMDFAPVFYNAIIGFGSPPHGAHNLDKLLASFKMVGTVLWIDRGKKGRRSDDHVMTHLGAAVTLNTSQRFDVTRLFRP